MSKLIVFSAALLITASWIPTIYGQQKDPLEEINQLHNNRQYSQAAEAYQKLLAETADVPTRAKIKFNLGMTFRMLKQYDRSIESFKEVLAMEVDDREPGGHIMELYRNYRPRALWEIGYSLFAKGDYAEALDAFRTARGKYKTHSGCGTCRKSIERRNNVVEGITLEALGRYSEAVVPYLKADEPRLAEMYFKAGQLDDLRAIVEKNIEGLMRKNSWQRYYAIQNSRFRNLQAMIEAYDHEKAKNWRELIKSAYVYGRFREFGRNNIPANILARHTDEVPPLLRNELRRQLHANEIGVIYEILALSGTDDSIALLKELLSKNGIHWENAITLIRALGPAGEKGRKLLDELESMDRSNFKPARHLHGQNNNLDEFGRFEIKFPRIGEIPALPEGDEIPGELP